MSEAKREETRKAGWIEVRLQGPLAGLEVFAEILNERGARGAVFSESPQDAASEMVTGFIPLDLAVPDLVEELRVRATALSEDFPGWWGPLEVTEIRDQDWVEKWKEKLEPIRIEPGLWIVPTFKDVPPHPASEPVIRFDPGMAFGTGRHPTTRASLKFMVKEVRKRARTVLDLGTGSGLLAIAAALSGAGRVLALDVDGHALKVARGNVEQNAVADKVELQQGISDAREELGECFDLIVANLYAEALVKLMPFIAGHLAERGSAVLSGILEDRADMVTRASNEHDMEVTGREEEQGWVTLTVKPGAKRS